MVEKSSTPFETLSFETLQKIVTVVQGETPAYAYFEEYLVHQINMLKESFQPEGSPVKVTIRYAMKALSNINILKIFDREGIHFDCSSIYEVIRVMKAGVDPSHIELASQELTKGQLDMLRAVPGSEGVLFVASSNQQLDLLLSDDQFKHQVRGVRVNPGFGSGYHSKTVVAGPKYSFGIWHEHLDQLRPDFKVRKIHSHIGAGSDPTYWLKSAKYLLDLIEEKFPDVEVLNLGGGFKIARGDNDKETDVKAMASEALKLVEDFNIRTGRCLKVEIEPGTFLVANSGILIAEVIDRTSTHSKASGDEGHHFVKLNTGLNEVTRPALYGAQHSIRFMKREGDSGEEAKSASNCVIVGHCCESGDLITCQPGDSNELREMSVPDSIGVGDFAVIKGTGAYCSAMSLKNYNSFPEASEVLVHQDGRVSVIRKRQSLDQIMMNEVDVIGNKTV